MLQQVVTQMQSQHHLLGNASPYFWEQQPGPVELGGSLAAVSSSMSQRAFSVFPSESSITRNAAYNLQGPAPGPLQPEWPDSRLLPLAFNGLQAAVDLRPGAFITNPGFLPPAPLAPPHASASATAAISQSQAATVTCGVGGLGGMGPQSALGLPLTATATAGGRATSPTQPSPPPPQPPPQPASAPMSLGPRTAAAAAASTMKAVPPQGMATAAADLTVSPCTAAAAAAAAGVSPVHMAKAANGLCEVVSVTSDGGGGGGGGGGGVAAGTDLIDAIQQAATGGGSAAAAAAQQQQRPAPPQPSSGGLSLRRIKPAAPSPSINLQAGSQKLGKQQLPVPQLTQLLQPPISAVGDGTISGLLAHYNQHPGFAGFLGCEPSSSVLPAAPSTAAAFTGGSPGTFCSAGVVSTGASPSTAAVATAAAAASIAVVPAAAAAGCGQLQIAPQRSSTAGTLTYVYGAPPRASGGGGAEPDAGGGGGGLVSAGCLDAAGDSFLAARSSDPGVSPFSHPPSPPALLLRSGSLDVANLAAANASAAVATSAAAPLGIQAAGSATSLPVAISEPLQQQQLQPQPQLLQQLQQQLQLQQQQVAGIPISRIADPVLTAMTPQAATAPTPPTQAPGFSPAPAAQEPTTTAVMTATTQQQQAQPSQQQQQLFFAPAAVPQLSPAALQLMAFSQMAQAAEQRNQQQQATAALSLMQQLWRAPFGMMMPPGLLGLTGMGMAWPPGQLNLTGTPAMAAPGAPLNNAAAAAAAAAAAQFPALFNPAMMLPALAPFALPLQAAAAAAAAAQQQHLQQQQQHATIAAVAAAAASVKAMPGNRTFADGGTTAAASQASARGAARPTKGTVKTEAMAALATPEASHRKQQHEIGGPASLSGPEAAGYVPSTRGPTPPSSPPPLSSPLPPLAPQPLPDVTAFAGAPAFQTAETADPKSDPAAQACRLGRSSRSRLDGNAAAVTIAVAATTGVTDGADDGVGDAAGERTGVAAEAETEAASGAAAAASELEVTRLQSFASADLVVVVDALQLLAASPPTSPHRERRVSGTSGASVTTTGGGGSRRSSGGGGVAAAGVEVRTKEEAGKGAAAATAETARVVRLTQAHPPQARRLFDLPDPAPVKKEQQQLGGVAAVGKALGVAVLRGHAAAAGRPWRNTSPQLPLPLAATAASAAVAPSMTGTLDRQRLLHLATVGAERVRRAVLGHGGEVIAGFASDGLQLALPPGTRRRRTRVARAAAAPGGAFLAALREAAAAAATECGSDGSGETSTHAVAAIVADGLGAARLPPRGLTVSSLPVAAAVVVEKGRSDRRSSCGGGGGGRRVQWAARDEDTLFKRGAGPAVPAARAGEDGEQAMYAAGVGGEEEEEQQQEEDNEREGEAAVLGVRPWPQAGRRHRGAAGSEGDEDSDEDYDMQAARRRARGARRGSGGGGSGSAPARRMRGGGGGGGSGSTIESDGGDGLTSEEPGHGYADDGDDDLGAADTSAAAARRHRSGHGRPPGAGNLRKMKPRRVQSDGRLGFAMRSSKYTGVYRTPGGRWRAQFCYRGAVHQLGMYDTEREAAAAWDQAVVTFRGNTSGLQLNLPQLLNSYDLQNVREHIHRILDSKIASTRTKRCLNSYARNPPGPKSPSRVVPAAVMDSITSEVCTEADGDAPLYNGGGGGSTSGGGGGISSHLDLSALPAAAAAAGVAAAAATAENNGGVFEAAAAIATGVGGQSGRSRSRAAPVAARGSSRRRRSPTVSGDGGPDDSCGDSDGDGDGEAGSRPDRKRARHGASGDVGSGGGAAGSGVGGNGVITDTVIGPSLHPGHSRRAEFNQQQEQHKQQLQLMQQQQQRLGSLPVGDAALLGMAALRRRLPMPPALIDMPAGAADATPSPAPLPLRNGNSVDGGTTTTNAPAAAAGAAAAATAATVGTASAAATAMTAPAEETVPSSSKRPAGGTAGGGAAAASTTILSVVRPPTRGSVDAEGLAAKAGTVRQEAHSSSSGGEGDGAGARWSRPSSPKRRKRQAIRSRDC